MARGPLAQDKLDSVKDLIGVKTDKEVAALIGAHPITVLRYRKAHGITSIRRGGRRPEAEGVGAQVAEAGGVEASAGTTKLRRRGRASRLDGFRDQIGKLSDADLATLAGVTVEAVRVYRTRHNLGREVRADAPKPRGRADKALRRRSKLDPYLSMLGKEPDARIASLAGVTAENVRAFRRRHGIGSYKEEAPKARTRGQGSPAVSSGAEERRAHGHTQSRRSPAARPAPGMGQQAYLVHVGGSGPSLEFVVIAHDIVTATQRAIDGVTRAGHAGEVLSIRWLAPSLD